MKKGNVGGYLIVAFSSLALLVLVGLIYLFGGHTTKINKVIVEHIPAQQLTITSTSATTIADTHGVSSPTVEDIDSFYKSDSYSLLVTFNDGSTYTTEVESLDQLKAANYRPGATIERILDQTKVTYEYSVYDRNHKFIKADKLTTINPSSIAKEGLVTKGNSPDVALGSDPVIYLTKAPGNGKISLDIHLQHRAVSGVKVKTAFTVHDGDIHFDI